MGGITLTVCLPDSELAEFRPALARALAPFDMNSEQNPWERGMWQSWRIAGGSNGLGFAIVEGHEHDPRLIHDDPLWGGEARPSVPGACAGGPRSLLDFTRPSAAGERFAAATWDLWHGLLAAYPSTVPLSVFLQARKPGSDRTRMRELLSAYLDQPAISAFLEHPWTRGNMSVDDLDPREHPVMRHRGDREAWIHWASHWLPPSTDILTPDGWWIESWSGRIRHGTCESQDSCPHDPGIPNWPGAQEYLVGLDPQSVLVRLRCTD